jgi:hypothetical protein
MPFESHLDICHQNEGYAYPTYIKIDGKTYDLTSVFAYITEVDTAKIFWTFTTIDIDKDTIGNNTRNSRLLINAS